MVGALAEALRLDDVDRGYLFALAGHRAPDLVRGVGPGADLLQRLVDAVAAPAYCTDALTSVLAYNAEAVEVFGDYGRWPADRRNLLTLLFDEPTFAVRVVDRAEYAARVVHTFRGRTAAYLSDPVAIAMVDGLARRSPSFRRLWEGQDVRRADTDALEVELPDGRRTLTLVTMQSVVSPGVRLNVYLAATGTRVAEDG